MSTTVSFEKKLAGFDFSMDSILALAKRRRYFSISLLAWLSIIVLLALVVVPAVQGILAIRQELMTAQDELDTKQRLISSLDALDTTDITRANTVLSAALPVEKPVLPVLYSIDRLATNALVSVANFQVSPGLLGTGSAKLTAAATTVSPISPLLATLPLKMNVSGGFTNLSTFFQSLDNVVPFIQINSIQFSTDAKANEATSSAEYSAEVALSSLYLKNAFTGGKVTSVVQLTPREVALLDRLTKSNEERLADSVNAAVPVMASSSGLIFTSSQ